MTFPSGSKCAQPHLQRKTSKFPSRSKIFLDSTIAFAEIDLTVFFTVFFTIFLFPFL